MAYLRVKVCSKVLVSTLLIGLVTHRFLKCRKCNKVTSHRYDLITDRWKCIICEELREESSPDHSLTPIYSSESISDLMRGIIMLALTFVVAYILMYHIIPLV